MIEQPSALPFGWFMVSYSDALAPGDVRPVRLFGRELVLFRTLSGQPALLDAYCPHLGAHLGHGGSVNGETLQCPFHAWRWDTAGHCAHIPYSKRIPPQASVDTWSIVEHSGRVWAWHGPDQPAFEIPEIPEETDEAWKLWRSDEYTIKTSVQEMSENQADIAHFYAVHGANLETYRLDAKFSGPTLELRTSSANRERGEADDLVVDGVATGMGVSVLRYIFDDRLVMLQVFCATPIDSETAAARQTYRIRADASEAESAMAIKLAEFAADQFGNDIPIWENKVYRPAPMLCDGDGLISGFRRWCRQFYPGHVP